jgi:RNA polymerase sigma factor (sigma-70 family)
MSIPAESPASLQVASLEDIDISRELQSRPASKWNRRAETTAMYLLAGALRESLPVALKRLATLAIELCSAGSGGVSVIEDSETGPLFRWQALAGEVERFEGGSTPRDWSPCGECLRARRAVLYSRPARYFTYFESLQPPIEEGLVIPVLSGSEPLATIWIVSHNPASRFNAEHVRIMTSLADFTASALGNADSERPGVDADNEIVWREYLKRIVRHDENALEMLFDETRALVFSAALRIVSFKADAEEVTADVFARLWKAAETFNAQRGTVGAWLSGIARNRALDRLRNRTVRERSPAALLRQCDREDPESILVMSERKITLQRALQALPAPQRHAIELFYFSDKHATDIAAELGCPLGTVKTRLRLGTIRLRQLMAVLEKTPDRRSALRSFSGIVPRAS